jgi:hypothetical protein
MINIQEHLAALPSELRKQLSPGALKTGSDHTPAIISLLHKHGQLTVDQILVGLFVEHKITARRSKVWALVKALGDKGAVERIHGYRYSLTAETLAALPAQQDPDPEPEPAPQLRSPTKPPKPPGAQVCINNISYKRSGAGRIFRWSVIGEEWQSCTLTTSQFESALKTQAAA